VLELDVLTYPAERFEQILPSPGAPVTVRVFGPDLQTLTDKAEEIRQAISGVEGVVDPVVQALPEEPTLDIEVDLDAAARHGIVPGEVRRAAAALLSGIQVGSLFDEQKVFDVVVWGTPEVRNDLSAVEDLAIDTVDGDQIRLGDVADVHVASSPSVINHVDVSRSVDVTAGVDGRDLGAVLADVRSRIDAIDFPLEYHSELVEGFSDARADDRQAADIAIGAAIAILLLIQAGLGNWRIALASVALLPIALSGGAAAALLDGGVVSIGSIAGFFAVFAVTSRQMFVVTRHLQLVERRATTRSVEEAVRLGTRECFAPILTAAGTIAMLFAPLAFTGAIAGLEIVQPMAVVVLGGLLTSSLVVLFVLPALYQRFSSSTEADLTTVLADRTIDLTALEETELTSP
jgi:Cu/Ag efflux pump CusA